MTPHLDLTIYKTTHFILPFFSFYFFYFFALGKIHTLPHHSLYNFKIQLKAKQQYLKKVKEALNGLSKG